MAYNGAVRSWLPIFAVAVAVAACGGNNNDSCPADQTSCGGSCVDTLSSHDHCGSCDNACLADQVCGNGTCAAMCPLNQSECGGTCSDTSTDPMNCGGCGMACSGGDICVDSQCQVPCDHAMLMSPIDDEWGLSWDGLERTPAALDVAKATCQAFGARLPTATEAYRVSYNQSAMPVGDSFNTSYIWTLVPNDRLNQATLRLSDGGTSSTAATTATPYRCVCPAVLPKTFTGGRCNGTPGSECFTIGNYNIDSKDRPALRKSAAVWECTNDRAHLAEATTLIEGIRAGLPGSNALIETADGTGYAWTSTLKWSSSTWDIGGNVSYVDLRTPAPFRCAAPKVAQSPNSNTIANQFVGPLSPYKSQTDDEPGAAWGPAHDTCFVRGGHLPRSSELAELVQQGLPNGSSANLWTSDQVGYNGTNFLASVLSWSALDQRYSFQYTGGADNTATWAYKTDASHPFRCIYYPIDTTYTAPTSCNGGCFMVTGGGTPAPTMWFDQTDRPASAFSDAIADCNAAGGHLASERDLTEALRSALANGSNAYLFVADLGFGFNGSAIYGYYTMVVRWADTQTSYADQWTSGAGTTGDMTWSDTSAAAMRPYRCMWTNELR
jgi:Stigma-specific protein, Stig1